MCSLSLDEFNAAIINRNSTETSLLNDYCCSFEFCLPQPMEAKAQCYLIYLCLAKLDQRKFLNETGLLIAFSPSHISISYTTFSGRWPLILDTPLQ